MRAEQKALIRRFSRQVAALHETSVYLTFNDELPAAALCDIAQAMKTLRASREQLLKLAETQKTKGTR